MKIAILGAGAYGTALGEILASKGYDLDYYDSRLERERLSDVVADAKYIILCVPSSAAPYVLPHLPKHTPLVIATKGILSDTAFHEFADWMVLSGPGFAADIKAHKTTRLTTTDPRVKELFATDYLVFDETHDRRGVLMCGALKNVYAILAGLNNLQPNSREHRQFLKTATMEMRSILLANDADQMTVDHYCGFDDLKLTCAYPSRNYEFGQKLRVNPNTRPEKTVEGFSALKRIRRGEIHIPGGLRLIEQIVEESKAWA